MYRFTELVSLCPSRSVRTGPKRNWVTGRKSPIKVVKRSAIRPASGVKLMIDKRLAFKDLNKNGKLDKYEDWRLPVDVRAKDLASKLTVEQIAGLMLYSKHQPIPAAAGGPFAGTYNGKIFAQSGSQGF